MMTEEKLERLFESARNARVETSPEEVTRWLKTAVIAGAAVTGFKLLLTKKALIMITGTLSIAGIAVVSTVVFSEKDPVTDTETQNVVTYADTFENDIEPESTYYAPLKLVEGSDESADYPVTTLNSTAENQVMNSYISSDNKQRIVFSELPALPADPATPLAGAEYIAPFPYGNRDTLKTASSSYDIPVGAFSQLRLDGVFDVVIDQGEQERITVESEQQDVVEAQMEGPMLVLTSLDSRGNSRCKDVRTVVVHITVKSLDLLEIAGIGNVTVEGLSATQLMVEFGGVGDLTMELSCSNLHLLATGVGNVYLSGQGAKATYEYDGVGDIRAYEYKAHEVNATNSGVGNMYIYADESLIIDANGIGDIRYQGNPDIKQLHFSGVGTLQSEDEKSEDEKSDRKND